MGTYLVTGGAGFIGSHIVEALVAAGHGVRVLDDLSFGVRENLAGLDVEFLEGDIRNGSLMARAVAGVDGVFHEAAVPSVPRSIEDPLGNHDVNATGTMKVLLAARDAGAKVVYAGSSSAYGNTLELPKREDMAAAPSSPYAATKLAAEHYMRSFAEVYGMQTVILRYFNVFGPRQRADSPYSGVVAKFCQWTLDEETCLIEGDGEQSRDFTYVGDVARGNLLAMQADIPGCTLLNLAGGTRYSLNDFIATLERITGAPVKRRHVAPRTGDVKHSQAAVECARSALGFTTEVSFEEGLRRTLDWYRAVSRTT